jgi:hypothetical protein
MPVSFSNSFESVELEIIQAGEKLNELLSGRLANVHAVHEAKENGDAIEV